MASSAPLAGVEEEILDNGFTVITKEVPSSPAISNWLWYRAGSRNESSGMTGCSHWVEHMLFKGTDQFPKGHIDRLLSKHGGVFNAFTSEDYTAFFETLPAGQLDLALSMEADRMRNAIFDPKEVESERTVILSEREGAENHPTYLLLEEVLSAAFKVHPYHHPVIGWRSDLTSMTRDDLYGYYREKYVPQNSYMVLVGRFDRTEALKRVKELYGRMPEGRGVQQERLASEPIQHGERRVSVNRPGNTEYLLAAFHTPEATHEDVYPLMLLDAVMGGAKALRSGPSFERSGRLHKALVERRLATAVSSSYRQTVDPHLFLFFVTGRNGVPIDRPERTLLREIERIKRTPPSRKEMGKALAQTEAQFAYATDGVTAQAHLIGSFQLRVGYRYLEGLLDRLAAVTPEDVRRAATEYLSESNRVVGIFQPQEEAT